MIWAIATAISQKDLGLHDGFTKLSVLSGGSLKHAIHMAFVWNRCVILYRKKLDLLVVVVAAGTQWELH